jgi:hypothetical protein
LKNTVTITTQLKDALIAINYITEAFCLPMQNNHVGAKINLNIKNQTITIMGHLNLPKRIHDIPNDFDGNLFQRWRDAYTIDDIKQMRKLVQKPVFDIVDGYVVFPIGDEITRPASFPDYS